MKLTAAQLEEELRVGTVDLSQVEIVVELGETLEESEAEQQRALAQALTGVVQNPPAIEPGTSVSFADVIRAQADKALETIPPDTRAAAVTADADQAEIEEAVSG